MKPTYRILIAHENRTTRWVYQELFQSDGYETVLVENGKAMIEELERGHYDLLVVDTHLNDGDTLETLQGIRRSQADLPVIITNNQHLHLIGSPDLSEGEEPAEVKPLTLVNLRKAVNKILGAIAQGRGCNGHDPLFCNN